MARNASKQRPHKPHELGPRIFFRGRWAGADLRPWGGARVTLRDPEARGWPKRGERTDWPDVAERWKWKYVDHLRGAARGRLLKIAPDARDLEDAIADYLAHREATAEPHTVRNDRSVLTGHLVTIGKTTADITPESLQSLFNRLARDGYAPSTLGTYRAVVSAFCVWAGISDVAGIVIRTGQGTDAEAWSDKHLATLRRAADRLDRQRERDPQWPASFRLLLELGVGCGARRAELLAIEWSALARTTRSVRLTRQLNERGNGYKGLKGKKNRTALVLPSWWQYSKRHGSGIVLEHAHATLHTVRDWARILYDAAGVTAHRAGWHTLRHTYARIFLESGGSLEQLQKSLGHESIVTTEQTYEHFTHERAAAAAKVRIFGR